MFKLGTLGLGMILSLGALSACSVTREDTTATEGYYFLGYVYDGVTNERLGGDAYSLTLSYDRREIEADVDDAGRFYVGPLEPFHDYTVSIFADGYRDFYAAEPLLSSPARGAEGVQSQLFEAYVFPTSVEAPAIAFTIRTPDGTAPSGMLRVSPENDDGTSGISLDGTIDGSVGSQIWANDADRKFATVVKEVSDGAVTFEPGELVYGVTYAATLFSSDGYQFNAFSFTAGLTDDTNVVIPRLGEQPLAIVANNLDVDNLQENAEVVLTFNRAVELSPTVATSVVEEAIDDGFGIVSPDFDADGEVNALTLTDEVDASERGTSIEIEGDTLRLRWAREEENFETVDGDDPILNASYDVSRVVLRPVDGRADEEATLESLLGSAVIDVLVDPANQ
jgi:hypothetical protein